MQRGNARDMAHVGRHDGDIVARGDDIENGRESIENDPKISNGWGQLESLYQAMGEDEKAAELREEALEKGVTF